MNIDELLKRYPIINREWVYVDCRGLTDSMTEHFNDYVILNMLNGNNVDLDKTCEIYRKESIRAYGSIWGHFIRRVDGNIGDLAIKNVDMWNRLFPKYMNRSGLYSDPYKYSVNNSDPAILCVQHTTVMGNSIYCLDMYDYRGNVYV